MSDHLDLSIDRVWASLTPRKSDVYVSRAGVVMRASESARHRYTEFVGSYTNAVSLRDFRDDVHHAWSLIGK